MCIRDRTTSELSPFPVQSEGCGHQAAVVGVDAVSTNEDKRVEELQDVTLHLSLVSSPRNSDKPTHANTMN